MRNALEPIGWIIIPISEISIARMYDSTRRVVDGMHIDDNIRYEISRVVLHALTQFKKSEINVKGSFNGEKVILDDKQRINPVNDILETFMGSDNPHFGKTWT